MDYLPIFMDMRGRSALIVGGGTVASRKAALVLKSGASITVVAPMLSPAMRTLIDENRLTYLEAQFEPEHLSTHTLVIAATDDATVNQDVYDAATVRRLPVNVADQTDKCSFILPAIVDRNPVVIAVSTGGRSPVLARFIKARLESLIPSAFGRLATLLGAWRQRIKDTFDDEGDRRRFWEHSLEGPIPEALFAGRTDAAEAMLGQELKQQQRAIRLSGAADLTKRRGEVYLIGAGPGDPDLLTFRAQRLLQRADIVLYDRLVSPGVLELCRREAELMFVGKRNRCHAVPQEKIGQLMAQYARQGKRVARLKGGDPFIFGRGGEEASLLAGAGIAFQVVPGISAANGCSSYAGFPLTHRNFAHGVSYWTAQRKANHQGGAVDLDFDNIARSARRGHTHVFFMGLGVVGEICRSLIAAGVSPDMPAAMVSKGTTVEQQTVTGTVSTLAAQVRRARLPSPAILYVGDVVRLREQLGTTDQYTSFCGATPATWQETVNA